MIALRRVHDHIDRHYAEPLTLADLAALVGMSRFHLVRAFRHAYGETPMRYLSRRRIERAQDLLRSANLTVTEICMLVGFTSLGSFSAKFTELVGESPVAYRNRWADKGPHIPGCYLFMRGVTPQFRRSPDDRSGPSVKPCFSTSPWSPFIASIRPRPATSTSSTWASSRGST